MDGSSGSADEADNYSADLYRCGFHDERLREGVGGTEFHPILVSVELLDGCFAVDHRHHRLAVLSGGLALHHDHVPVTDAVLDHAVSLNPEGKVLSAAQENLGD